MGKMKVKVTVKEKGYTNFDDKGVTKSKTVDIGKLAEDEDWDSFKVAEFKFKHVDKGDKYIACIAEACHDSTTITKKTVNEHISVERYSN
jgi:hypothetical protein